MKKRTRDILTVILLLVAAFALFRFAQDKLEAKRSQSDYEMALQIADAHFGEETVPAETSDDPQPTEDAMPDDPVIKELLAMDLQALREVNEDVLGWIHIPASAISYPLLQWTDNDFYLTHTWTQSENASGSIFMDYQNSPDFTDFNTIIYGHNMRNGDMFSELTSYRYLHHWQAHPYVYILCDEGVLRYDVFAVQSVNTNTIIYGLGIDSDQRKKEFLRFATDYSLVDTGITPGTDDSILTLSTCVDAAHVNRWVVLGRLNEEQSYRHPF